MSWTISITVSMGAGRYSGVTVAGGMAWRCRDQVTLSLRTLCRWFWKYFVQTQRTTVFRNGQTGAASGITVAGGNGLGSGSSQIERSAVRLMDATKSLRFG